MKKVFIILSLFLSLFLISCDFNFGFGVIPDDPNEEDNPQEQDSTNQFEEMYNIAMIQGFYGTFDDWINAISDKTIEFKLIDNKINWSYTNQDKYLPLIDVNDLFNYQNSNIEFKYDGNFIKWKYKTDSAWNELLQIIDETKSYLVQFTDKEIPGFVYFELKVLEGTSINNTLEEPIKEGYKFLGWYYNDLLWDFNTLIYQDIRLVAEWEKIAEEEEKITDEEVELLKLFGEEMVGLFNSTGNEEAQETILDNFIGTTHPNIKYVFSNSKYLIRYKWFFEYILEEITESCNNNGLSRDVVYIEVKTLLEKMISGDYDAINGIYPDGRTCIRQFIHRLINANNPNGLVGNEHYNPYTVDFSSSVGKLKEFIKLYQENKIINPNEQFEVKFIVDENIVFEGVFSKYSYISIPKVTKKGYNFLGWAKEANSLEIVNVLGCVEANETYYAVFEEDELFDEVYVDPNNTNPQGCNFNKITDALENVKDGGQVILTKGLYQEELIIQRPVNIIGYNADKKLNDFRDDISIIVGTVNLVSNDIVINGVSFQGVSNIKVSENIENISFISSNFDSYVDGIVYNNAGIMFLEEAKNILFDNCLFLSNQPRTILFEKDAKDITVTDCYFQGVGDNFDQIRFRGLVTGQVVIKNNTFRDSLQTAIQIANVTEELRVDVIDNIFENIKCSSIDIRTYKGDYSKANLQYNVIGNQFSGENEWGVIRFRMQGLTVNNAKVNINYNIFKNITQFVYEDDVLILYEQAGGNVDFDYVYGDYNYCDQGQYQDGWFQNCSVHSGWFSSAEELIKAYNIYIGNVDEPVLDVTLQMFADEMVALFNNVDNESKSETTQENFIDTTHPNIKYVFNNIDTLAKYKWFLVYALDEITKATTEANLLDNSIYLNVKELLERMIDGDTTAIEGSYADGRTCFRQFVHRLINAENPNGTIGNTYYDSYTVDYQNNSEKVKEFLDLYNKNK